MFQSKHCAQLKTCFELFNHAEEGASKVQSLVQYENILSNTTSFLKLKHCVFQKKNCFWKAII